MFNFSNKKKDKTDLFRNVPEKDSLDLLKAKTELAMAKRNNINVINFEIRRLRRANELTEDAAERAKQSVKNAYYALNIINWIEQTLTDMEIRNQLAQGMNRISDAMKLINNIDTKDEKPKTVKFKLRVRRLEGKTGRDGRTLDKMESTYERTVAIDSLVDNDVVDRLINGARLDDCIKVSSGIKIPYSDELNIDLDDLDEFVSSVPDFGDLNDIDFSNEDLDDLKL